MLLMFLSHISAPQWRRDTFPRSRLFGCLGLISFCEVFLSLQLPNIQIILKDVFHPSATPISVGLLLYVFIYIVLLHPHRSPQGQRAFKMYWDSSLKMTRCIWRHKKIICLIIFVLYIFFYSNIYIIFDWWTFQKCFHVFATQTLQWLQTVHQIL